MRGNRNRNESRLIGPLSTTRWRRPIQLSHMPYNGEQSKDSSPFLVPKLQTTGLVWVQWKQATFFSQCGRECCKEVWDFLISVKNTRDGNCREVYIPLLYSILSGGKKQNSNNVKKCLILFLNFLSSFCKYMITR